VTIRAFAGKHAKARDLLDSGFARRGQPTSSRPISHVKRMATSQLSRVRTAATAAVVAMAFTVAPGLVPAAGAQGPEKDGPLPAPLPILPADNWWNVDITQAPVDANSQNFINFINNGGNRRLHPDWGASAGDQDDPDLIYGIPYVVVPGSQPLVPVHWNQFGSQSDNGAPGRPPGYPIPDALRTQQGWFEGGAPGNCTNDNLDSCSGDRHILIVDRDNKILYELYAASYNNTENRWEAGSGAIWPMTTNHRRPDTWTSADAAGLAILPGLVRYDDAYGTEPIKHAFRVTVRSTNGYVYPASHRAGNTNGALPMGARLRLKESFDISGFAPHIRRVLQAMKTYGLIVADNGTDMYITGTSDPRWTGQMGNWNTAFHNQVHASDFEVVQLGWQPTGPPPPPPDTDGDGLPNDWETRYGLDPNSASGPNGATGDPDDDDIPNNVELTNGTHPNGRFKRYFAEGVSNTFFSTRMAAVNPGASAAHVLFRFLRTGASTVTHDVTIPARGRITIDPSTYTGAADYSTVIESDFAVVADRTVSWDSRGYGSHAESSVASPSPLWYLAEGATTWEFALFYLLQNPNAEAATATVRYLRPGGETPISKDYTLPANSRTTIEVAVEDAGLADTDVSAEITSTRPIIAERAMYLNRPGQPFGAGHGSAGVTAASTNWFLAEGATGTFFDLFILIANPNNSLANVQATYMLPGGVTHQKTYTVAANSRSSIWVDAEMFDGQALLASTPMSVKLVSVNDVPVIVERTMWWPDGQWYESHNAPGSTTTGVRWALAEGEVGGAGDAQTYILIANTSATAGQARVTVLLEGGGEATRTYTLEPNSRTSVPVGSDFPTTVNARFGTLIESLGATPAQIVVERAMYTNVGGVTWAAGTNAAATCLDTPQ
jgi:hypothetical protein